MQYRRFSLALRALFLVLVLLLLAEQAAGQTEECRSRREGERALLGREIFAADGIDTAALFPCGYRIDGAAELQARRAFFSFSEPFVYQTAHGLALVEGERVLHSAGARGFEYRTADVTEQVICATRGALASEGGVQWLLYGKFTLYFYRAQAETLPGVREQAVFVYCASRLVYARGNLLLDGALSAGACVRVSELLLGLPAGSRPTALVPFYAPVPAGYALFADATLADGQKVRLKVQR